MLGLMRQEITFADHCRKAGRPQRWISTAVVLTSHTWENGKNEMSHQDPTLVEALWGEPRCTSRVLFPADHNTASAAIHGVYATHGQVWTLVVSNDSSIPN